MSSFGTEKGYPIVARCVNLPVHIRNSNGVGGGQIVGWLPIVSRFWLFSSNLSDVTMKVAEDPSETGKKGFVNHKHAVWHSCFLKFLESVAMHSKTGYHHPCADGVTRWLFPLVLILSADYEEQYVSIVLFNFSFPSISYGLCIYRCVMSLIRGLKGLCPCPKCLIPQDKLSDFTEKYDLRTQESTQNIFQEARDLGATAKDDFLKKYGLRDVQVDAFYYYTTSSD